MKDIYGGDCTSLGLPGDLIASSFGKAAQAGPDAVDGSLNLFTASNDGQSVFIYLRFNPHNLIARLLPRYLFSHCFTVARTVLISIQAGSFRAGAIKSAAGGLHLIRTSFHFIICLVYGTFWPRTGP